MLEILDSFCRPSSQGKQEGGLMVLEMCTGSGKSYNARTFIRQCLDDPAYDGKKFIFVTDLKKNLGLKEFRESLGLEHQDELVFVDSDKDCFLARAACMEKDPSKLVLRFDEIRKQINEEKFPLCRTKAYQNFSKDYDELKRVMESRYQSSKEKDKNGTFLAVQDGGYLQYLEERFSRSVSALNAQISRMLRNKLAEKKVGERSRAVDKLNQVRELPEWQWLPQLYPQMEIPEKRVILMSISKLLTMHNPLYSRRIPFISRDFLKDSIVFIDEFDRAKGVIEKKQREDALRLQVDLPSLITDFRSKLNELILPYTLCRPADLEAIEKQSEKLKERIEAFRNKYSSKKRFRTSEDLREEISPLLCVDREVIDVSKHPLIVDTCSSENINIIRPKTDQDTSPLYLGYMLKEADSIAGQIVSLIFRIAKSHSDSKFQETGAGQEDNLLGETSVLSVIDHFFNEPREREYIRYLCLNHIPVKKSSEAANQSSVFEKGFRVFTLVNSENHEERTALNMWNVSETPEKLLVKLASHAKVIGLSATGLQNTVLTNFSIEYLQETLKERFVLLDEASLERLNESYSGVRQGYKTKNIQVKTSFLDSEDELQTMLLSLGLNESEANQMDREFREWDWESDGDFYTRRYFRYLSAYLYFLTHEDIHSFLCLGQSLPGKEEKSRFSERVFRDMASEAVKHLKGNFSYDDKAIVVLRSADFGQEKEKLLAELSQGKKRFVISSYATLGAGQNMQYPVDIDGENQVLFQVFKRPGQPMKDFDALYLEKPTNIIRRVDYGTEMTVLYDQLLERITQAERLNENGDISYRQLKTVIANAMKKESEERSRAKDEYGGDKFLYQTPSAKHAMMAIIEQAVGRLCRSSWKNQTIHILCQKEILDDFDPDAYSQRMRTPEMDAFVEMARSLQKKQTETESPESALLDEAWKKTVRTADRIQARLEAAAEQNFWSDEDMAAWNFWRHFVLAHPTISKRELDVCMDPDVKYRFYVQVPEGMMLCWKNDSFDDVEKIVLSFQPLNRPASGWRPVNAASVGLASALKCVPGLEQHMDSQSLPTAFSQKGYVMNPYIARSLYQGALGEMAGAYCFERAGIELQEIQEGSRFEKFDFWHPASKVYVDFKNWNAQYHPLLTKEEKQKEYRKFAAKAKACQANTVIIANLLSPEGMQEDQDFFWIQEEVDGQMIRMLFIQSLVNRSRRSFNQKSMEEIIRVCSQSFI